MKRRHLWMMVGLVGALGAIGIGWVLWSVRPRAIEYWTDGSTVREQDEVVRVRDVLWTPAARLGDAVNTGVDEYEPRTSADGNTLWFVRGRAGGDAQIWVSQRTPDGWGEAALFEPTSSPADELGPCPNDDGSAVYFYSDRDGGFGGYDVWVVRRGENGWGEPANLGPGVNSPLNDYGPALAPDGARLYFASNRPTDDQTEDLPDDSAWSATIREDLFSRHYDVYEAPIGDHGHGPAAIVTALSSPANDGAPAVSPVGDFVYFSSDRSGGEGGFDLYRARLLDGAFMDVENLGAPVNTPANELDPSPAMEGFALHFSSDRPSVGMPGGYDVYRSVSREVFREVEVVQADFGWGVVWAKLWPWLLALLLALLLLALLARLANDERWRARWRALSLMTQCVLLSLLAHMLLMTLFAAWKVTTSLEGLMRAGGGQRVALTTSAGGGDIASQVRGGLADVSYEAARPVELAPAAFTPAWEAPAQVEAGATETAVERKSVTHEWTQASEAAPSSANDSQLQPAEVARRGDVEASLPEVAGGVAVSEREVEVEPVHLASGAARPEVGGEAAPVEMVEVGVESLSSEVRRDSLARGVYPVDSEVSGTPSLDPPPIEVVSSAPAPAVTTPGVEARAAESQEAALETGSGVRAPAAMPTPQLAAASDSSETWNAGVESLPLAAARDALDAGSHFEAPDARGAAPSPPAPTLTAPAAAASTGGEPAFDIALPGTGDAAPAQESEGEPGVFTPGALAHNDGDPSLPLGGPTIGEDTSVEAPLDFVVATPERIITSDPIESDTPSLAQTPDLPPGGLPSVGLPTFDVALPVAEGDGDDGEAELRLSGVVIDGATGQGLPGALVRIDLSEGDGRRGDHEPQG